MANALEQTAGQPMTIGDWLRLQGLQDSDNFNGGRSLIDPANTGASFYDDVSGGVRNGSPFNFDYRQLPGYEQFLSAGTGGVSYGGADPVEDKFDWAGWSAANPGYKLESGNLGGRSGTLDFVTGPDGQLVGSPTFNRNTSLSDARNIALVVAGGYFGGNALANAYGGGAAGGMTAAEAGALDSAMIDMGAGATNVSAGGGATTAATGATTAGSSAANTSGYWNGTDFSGSAPQSGSSNLGGGNMSWADWASLASNAYQAYQNNQARGDQNAATNAAIEEQRRQFNLTRDDFAPYRGAGVAALGQLTNEMGQPITPQEVMSDPGYQFGLNQGQQAIDRRIAASGGRVSGRAIRAAGEFGTNYASTGYGAAYQRRQDRLNRLAAIAGIGQTSTSGSAAAGANSSNAIADLLSNQGDANAASRLAQGNIWGNAINQWGATVNRGRGGQDGRNMFRQDDPYRNPDYYGGSEGE